MATSTARTGKGKLKRSKARRESSGEILTREASVEELVAGLDADAPSPGPQQSPLPDDPALDPNSLGLVGYEDDDSHDEPAPPPEAVSVEPRADGVELSETLPMAPEDDLSRIRGQASPRLMSVVESLLFASDRPLTVRDIRQVLKEPTVRQVQLALKQVQHDRAAGGIVLSQVAGGFRFRTNPANAQWVQRMLAGKPARLTRSQLEALAVIAYRQPITKPEVDHVRGVDCGAVLRHLLERDLVRIVGRKEEPGRPHLYGTTVEFLEFFNLRSLRDMPNLHEFRELTDESRETLRDELGEDADELEAEVLGQEVLSFDGPRDGSTATAEVSDDASEPVESKDPATGDDCSIDSTSDRRAPDSSDSEVTDRGSETDPSPAEYPSDRHAADGSAPDLATGDEESDRTPFIDSGPGTREIDESALVDPLTPGPNEKKEAP